MPSLYDLSGSANFANKADYGLIIHRQDPRSVQTEVRCAKVRMGLPGKMESVTLEFDADAMDYRPWQRFYDESVTHPKQIGD